MFNNWSLGKHILASVVISIFMSGISYLIIKSRNILTSAGIIEGNYQGYILSSVGIDSILFISLATFVISMIGYRFVKRMLD
ncbi:hypothetical protein SDC9_108987 [bioreactor metagenome]|uniref:Uncharacterized protein n=1 Tax=bioreactor metagenome TaxID=1076179 RepID=A0A645BBT3_9ZZZZ|nr:hypothetical protein [Romboutsia lituseburensis]